MIEDKISKDFKEYEIKTTADDILNKLPAKHVKKPSKRTTKFKWSYFIPVASLVAVAACALIFVFVFSPFFKQPTNKNINKTQDVVVDRNVSQTQSSLIDTDTSLSMLSLELFYAGSILSNVGIDNSNNSIANALDSTQFDTVTSNAYDSYFIIDSIFKNKSGLSYLYKEIEDYSYNNKTYKYSLEVGEYTLYLQNDIVLYDEGDGEQSWESDALVSFNNKTYDGKIEIEKELEESSIELIYYDGDYIYSIEKDHESQEFSIEYTVYYCGEEEKNIVESYAVELEYDKQSNLECTYEYFNRDKNVYFTIETTKTNNGYIFNYLDEQIEIDNEDSDDEEDDEEEVYIVITIIDNADHFVFRIDNKERIFNK